MQDQERQWMMFRIVITSILVLGSTYVGWRLTATLGQSFRSKVVIWSSLAIFLGVQILATSQMRKPGVKLLDFGPTLLNGVSYGLLGAFGILFFFLAANDLLYFLARFLPPVLAKGDVDPARRESFRQGLSWLAVGSATLMSGVGYVMARMVPKLKEVDVPIEGLPREFDGFRIVQISDLHVAPLVRREYVQEIVRISNDCRPDYVALTGDFLDGTVEELRPEMAPLQSLQATHGVGFVVGNHEYYWGVNEWVDEFRRLGFKTLLNQHQVIQHAGKSLLVVGLTDPTALRMASTEVPNSLKAIEGAPSADFRLLLVHQPKMVSEAEKIPVDLQLSGHTHNGQFFPFNMINYLVHKYHKGLNLHRRKDGKSMWVYVNPGSGFWGPPNRFGVPSEVTLLRLKSV